MSRVARAAVGTGLSLLLSVAIQIPTIAQQVGDDQRPVCLLPQHKDTPVPAAGDNENFRPAHVSICPTVQERPTTRPTPDPTPPAPAPPPPPPPPPDPAAVAEMVAASLTLADPVPMTAPDHRTSVTITGLDTWFWVEGLRATDATVDVGGLGVTVSARPTSTTWTIQDHVVRCDSLGLPYSPMRDAPCGYVFQHISPPGGHAVQVAVRWTRTWKASDGRTGLLPDTTTAASFDLVVEQIQVTTD